MEITASGRADLAGNNGTILSRLVHAVSVSQPVQSWTVIREHGDFITLGNALSTSIGGIPACPAAPAFDACNNSHDVNDIVKVRNAAQNWLSNILLFPGARESPAVHTFLCYDANFVPTHFQGVNWIPFTHTSPSVATPESANSSIQDDRPNQHRGEEELEMDEMFAFGDGPADDHYDGVDDEVGDYDEDGAEYFSATERYQPTEETVIQDDVMEFQNNVDDVEMIEDVGSLAQSLGASHLGRSLQLQAQMARGKPHLSTGADAITQPQQGLNIGGMVSSNNNGTKGVGGIGNSLEQAAGADSKVEGLSDSFFQKKPVSAPKLDSFKMIKVVGKGSFGELRIYTI